VHPNLKPPGPWSKFPSTGDPEIPCRRAGAQSPSVLVTSAILGGADAHSHIAPHYKTPDHNHHKLLSITKCPTAPPPYTHTHVAL
jgi:hypothetical protein